MIVISGCTTSLSSLLTREIIDTANEHGVSIVVANDLTTIDVYGPLPFPNNPIKLIADFSDRNIALAALNDECEPPEKVWRHVQNFHISHSVFSSFQVDKGGC